MRTRHAIQAILPFVLLLCAAPFAAAEAPSDPILRFDSSSDMEMDLGAIHDDLLPLLMNAAGMESEEDAQMLAFFLDLLGVEALDRVRVESQSSKDEAVSKITLTLDPDANGGLLAELFAVPPGECRFDEYVREDELIMFSTIPNLAAYLEFFLDTAARPELQELMGEVPVDENGEISIEGFTPRTDLLPLLSGELDIFMLDAPEGTGAMSPDQMPYFLVFGTHDGPALLDKILEIAVMMGGEEAAGFVSMISEMPHEAVGDFDLIAMPMGGAIAVSDDFLVVGIAVEKMRDMLSSAEGDLKVPESQSWAFMNGPKYGAIMENVFAMANMMAPVDTGDEAWMARMYAVLFEHIETEEVLTTGDANRMIIETDVKGTVMTGLYEMFYEFMTELPTIIEQERLKRESQEEARAVISILDAALTQYGIDHDGLFPSDPVDLLEAGYLEEFPLSETTPAGLYVEGAYTYHALYNDAGQIAGYYLFVYGGGEGTGFDVYTAENLADLENFVIASDGYNDGVASFCYDGLALEQWEAWSE